MKIIDKTHIEVNRTYYSGKYSQKYQLNYKLNFLLSTLRCGKNCQRRKFTTITKPGLLDHLPFYITERVKHRNFALWKSPLGVIYWVGYLGCREALGKGYFVLVSRLKLHCVNVGVRRVNVILCLSDKKIATKVIVNHLLHVYQSVIQISQ